MTLNRVLQCCTVVTMAVLMIGVQALSNHFSIPDLSRLDSICSVFSCVLGRPPWSETMISSE